ncbi:MAG: hypothetical protein AAF752_00810 [Bacteroidota bacterium]
MTFTADGVLHVFSEHGVGMTHLSGSSIEQLSLLATRIPLASYPRFTPAPRDGLKMSYTAVRANAPGEGGRNNVYVGRLEESGGIGEEVLAYEHRETYSHRPHLLEAVDGQRHLVWSQNFGNGVQRAYYSESKNGAYWTTPVEIMAPVERQRIAELASALDGAGRLHIVVNTRTPPENVYLRRDTDGTWSRPQRLFPSRGVTGTPPKLVFDSKRGTLHLFADDASRRIYHTTMTRLNE